MVGVTASVLIGVMNPLLSRLCTILEREYTKIKCVHRQIVFLRDELRSMSAALEMVSESEEENPQVKEWMSQLRDLSYDVEDCIEIFMHRLGNDDTCDGFIHKIINKVTNHKAHYQIGNQINELKERALEVSARRNRYQLHPSASAPQSPVIDPRLPALFEEADRLVGIDTQMDKIAKWFMDAVDLHPQRKVVSIVGLGGLGKTTLANQVFHKFRSQFDCAAFVSVNRSPNVSKVLSHTLEQFLKSSSPLMEDQNQNIVRMQENLYLKALEYPQLVNMNRDYLQNRRYFVIIDDIWAKQHWNEVQCAFPHNNNGSRIMITTRIEDVARFCSFPHKEYIYPMRPLESIFKQLEDFHFRPSMYCRKKKSMLSLVFEAGAMPRLKRLWFRFIVHDTLSAYGVGFDFGISLLLSLERLWVSINCCGAEVWEVETAKENIKNAAVLLPNRPRHEIHIFGDDEMVKDEDRR